MRPPRSSVVGALFLSVFALGSCKGASCDPADPLCGGGSGGGGGGGGGGAQVATVTVTSSIDTVVAVGGPMATLTATARDANANTVAVTFNWSSQNASIATVNAATGVVTAGAAGRAVIVAAQSNNSVTGQLGIRAVSSNLAGVSALLTEPFQTALRGQLSATPQGSVNGLVSTCQSNVTSGNILAINTCLTNLIAVPGSNGNDNALLGVLDLFYAVARTQLQL